MVAFVGTGYGQHLFEAAVVVVLFVAAVFVDVREVRLRHDELITRARTTLDTLKASKGACARASAVRGDCLWCMCVWGG